MSSDMKKQSTAALMLAAIGVVYGDIGTSPLYTIKETFSESTGVAVNPANLIGVVSVIVWALMLVVTLKYVILILRADNRGEGGIMALVALAAEAAGKTAERRAALLLVGVCGAALFYGDSVITPAISVLSAVEGLEVITPTFKPLVLPISVGILVGLFLLQRYGTAAVGRYFGPIIVLWFVTLAIVGALAILDAPEILTALNPMHGIRFLYDRGWGMFIAVGAIVLALTGAEALYADLGHFGRRPIQLAWTLMVYPSLALNYLGQGALLIADPKAIENPFYRLFPESLLLPAVLLASVATVIASQAVISGAYSMTKQAILLGFLPRMRILYTSAAEMGQIYIPQVNWLLLLAVLIATLSFGSSTALAAAYGIAVTLTMLITTFLTYFVVRYRWKMHPVIAIGATAFFFTVDALLVAACSLKFMHGGWFPVVLGLAIVVIMSTWKQGRALLYRHLRSADLRLEPFMKQLLESPPHRVPGTAVYLVADPDTIPHALLHNLKHNKVLHERIVFLTVRFEERPWVPEAERVEASMLDKNVWRVGVRYGFKDSPDIPEALRLARRWGLETNAFETSFFVNRETIVPTAKGGMSPWREQLFATMSRTSGSVVEFFKIPTNNVIELGTRVQI